jgi:hypothetical protein
MACPYNPNLLLMDWVQRIEPLFRFAQNVNVNSAGSQTPHVNIDLDNMRIMRNFLTQELDAVPDGAAYEALCATVRTLPVVCSDDRWRDAFHGCVTALRRTCPWVTTK